MGHCFLYKRGKGSGGGNPSLIVMTVLGNFLSLTNASGRKLKGLRIFGKTTQNGTPTPEAPVPLESVGESVNVTVVDKNLLSLPYHNSNNFTHNGIQYTVKPNGAVVCNGTATAESLFTVKYLMTLPAGTYFLCGCPLASGGQLYLRTEDKGVIVRAKKEGAEFTLTKDDTLAIWVDIFTGTKVENVVFYPVICKKRQTAVISTPNGLPGIPVSSDGNYTDENGQQWICDEVDFAKGVYVQRIKSVNMIDLNGGYNGSNFWFSAIKDKKIGITNLLCSHYPVLDKASGATRRLAGGQDSTNLFVYDTEYNDWNVWRAVCNDAVILYELAEPIETHLPAEELAAYAALHTNYPNTTIFNDEGAGMEVKYISIGG